MATAHAESTHRASSVAVRLPVNPPLLRSPKRAQRAERLWLSLQSDSAPDLIDVVTAAVPPGGAAASGKLTRVCGRSRRGAPPDVRAECCT